MGRKFSTDTQRAVAIAGAGAGQADRETGVVLPTRRGHLVDGRGGFVRGDTARGELACELRPGMFATHKQAECPQRRRRFRSPAPLAGIWVELLDMAGERLQLAQSNMLGQFAFSNLIGGAYQLRAAALGFPVLTRAVSVPSPSGEYNLSFV